jgi:hypothetical protein
MTCCCSYSLIARPIPVARRRCRRRNSWRLGGSPSQRVPADAPPLSSRTAGSDCCSPHRRSTLRWAVSGTVGAGASQTLAVGCSMAASGNTTEAPGTAAGSKAVRMATGCGAQGMRDVWNCSKEGARGGLAAPATCSTGQAPVQWPRSGPGEGAGSGTAPAGREPPPSPPRCASGRWGCLHRGTVPRCVPVRAEDPQDPEA